MGFESEDTIAGTDLMKRSEIELEMDEKEILEDTSRYKGPKLLFPVESKPPWHIVIAYALQVRGIDWINTIAMLWPPLRPGKS